MSQYNTLKVKFYKLQFNTSKAGIKNGTELMVMSTIVVQLLLTNTQVSRPHKAFANNSSANIKLSKTQLHKIRQPG